MIHRVDRPHGGWTTAIPSLAPVWVIAALITTDTTAMAQPEARDPFRTGVQRMHAAQYEKAIRLLRRAEARAEPGSRVLAAVRLHLGLSFALGGDFAKARLYFAAALRLDPTLRIDTDTYGPKILKIFRSILVHLRGELHVDGDITGARVSVDGERVGFTPMTRRLAVGRHVVRIEGPGAGRVERTITIRAGRITNLRARLRPADREGGSPAYLWTWISAGAAVAATAVGVGLYLAAGAQVDDHDLETDPVRRAGLEDEIRGKERAAYVTAGVGGALAVTAAVLYFVERARRRRRRDEHRPTARILATPTGLQLRW